VGSMVTPAVSSSATEPAAESPRTGAAPAPAVRSGNRMAAPTPAGAEPSTAPATSTPAADETGQLPTGGSAWVKPVAIIAGLVVVAAAIVLGARWLRTLEGVQEFIATYDGHSSQLASAPEGMPSWM